MTAASGQACGSAPANAAGGPLHDVRVLDLSRILAAPFTGQILADLGAEVIKVEKPGVGDEGRLMGPPFQPRPDGSRGDSALYLSANRGKRSITVNIASAEGQALIRKLALQSDVLIENYKVGDLARYGLDHAALCAINPALIYCSITGFGQTGPARHRPGYDAIFQGMSGVMSVTGPADGQPGAGPVKIGPSLADINAGLFAAVAICAALRERERTGLGRHVDIALLDSMLAATTHYAQSYLTSGEPPIRRGNEGNGGMPSGMYTAGDGKPFMITAGNDKQFAKLCEALGIPALATDPRFAQNAGRAENRGPLRALLEAQFQTRSRPEWLAILDACDVPVGPVNDYAEAFAEPQVAERAMQFALPHPHNPAMPMVGSPIKFGRDPASMRPPPLVGQHSAEILHELGLTDKEIARLQASGVV